MPPHNDGETEVSAAFFFFLRQVSRHNIQAMWWVTVPQDFKVSGEMLL